MMQRLPHSVTTLFVLFACYILLVAESRGQSTPVKQETAQYQVAYKKDLSFLGANREEKLDLYLPQGLAKTARVPGIVLIHGGGWFGGDKSRARQRNIGNFLASRGYVVVSINYKLARELENLAQRLQEAWPQNLYDAKTAVRWLRKNADKYQIDSKHIGVIGCSAGAQLCAMVALTRPSDGLEPAGPYSKYSSEVQAAAPMYGSSDLTLAAKTRNFYDSLTEVERKILRDASPINYIHKESPPLLLLHGSQDKTVPVKQTEIFAAALSKAGVPHQSVIVEGAGHSFHLQPKQQDLRPVVLAFFDKYLKESSSSSSSPRP